MTQKPPSVIGQGGALPPLHHHQCHSTTRAVRVWDSATCLKEAGWRFGNLQAIHSQQLKKTSSGLERQRGAHQLTMPSKTPWFSDGLHQWSSCVSLPLSLHHSVQRPCVDLLWLRHHSCSMLSSPSPPFPRRTEYSNTTYTLRFRVLQLFLEGSLAN